MAMSVRETPTRAVRVSYAVLVSVLGALGGLLVLAIVNPLITSTGVCASDETLFCGLAVGLIAWALGAWLVTMWLSAVFRLSWRFMVVSVALQLAIIQVVLQTEVFWWLLGLLVLPVAAALLTDPGHTRENVPRWQSLAILAGGVVVVVEFTLWLWFGVLAG
ncbi:MAG: hypothetical protein ACOH16_10495 [Propionibacteriaceae bacterium]